MPLRLAFFHVSGIITEETQKTNSKKTGGKAMFKKIVKQFSEVKTKGDFDAACGAIDTAYQQEKISWNDHEILYGLTALISRDSLPD